MIKNYIPENLDYLVSKSKVSMDDFGLLFDLKRGVIGQYIRKVSVPKLETIQRICKHYEITIDDFVNKDLSEQKVWGIKQGQLLYGDSMNGLDSKYTNPNFIDKVVKELEDKTELVETLKKTVIDKEKIIVMLEEKLQTDEKSKTA